MLHNPCQAEPAWHDGVGLPPLSELERVVLADVRVYGLLVKVVVQDGHAGLGLTRLRGSVTPAARGELGGVVQLCPFPPLTTARHPAHRRAQHAVLEARCVPLCSAL